MIRSIAEEQASPRHTRPAARVHGQAVNDVILLLAVFIHDERASVAVAALVNGVEL